MTSEEYIQLKAFTRQDGALLGLWWAATFCTFAGQFSEPMLSALSLLLIVMWPFFLGWRLKKFRDDAREGKLSFLRGWGYCVFSVFYASLVLAVVLYVFFAYIDNGELLNQYANLLMSDEGKAAAEAYGMHKEMMDSIDMMRALSPIEIVYNFMTSVIMTGSLVGAAIAAVLRKK